MYKKRLPIVALFVLFFLFVLFESQKKHRNSARTFKIAKTEVLYFDFENSDNTKIQFTPCDTLAYAGKSCSYVSPDRTYSNTVILDTLQNIEDLVAIRVKGYIRGLLPAKNIGFSCSFSNEEKVHIWNVQNISEFVKLNQWSQFDYEYVVEQSELPEKTPLTVHFYSYNNALDEFFLDDLSIKLLFK